MNAMLVIHPYKKNGVWMFDDPAAGLVQEPFISGADVLIDKMVEGMPNAEAGVTILFSAQAFPGFQHRFDWRREEMGGNWYFNEKFAMEGWLCPALFKYFQQAPEQIFVQVKPKAA
jgi:hypothetical protein